MLSGVGMVFLQILTPAAISYVELILSYLFISRTDVSRQCYFCANLGTLKKVYDRNVVNKYLLLGVIIYYLIDYINICTDAELFISFC